MYYIIYIMSMPRVS